VYDWTAYGVCTLLAKLYRQEMGHLQSGWRVSPYLLEFCCALERTLAFAHTGRVSHGYGNTRGVSKTGTVGTGTVVDFGTPQHTTTRTCGVAGIHGLYIYQR
jgi:hypothetical protein